MAHATGGKMPRPFRTTPAVPRSAGARALRLALAGLALTLGGLSALPVRAQAPAAEQRQTYDLPAAAMGPALSAFAAQAGVSLSFDPALTQGLRSPAVRGSLTLEEGFAGLLAGSGLEAVRVGGGGYTLRRSAVPPPAAVPAPGSSAAGDDPSLPAVRVTARPDAAGEPPAAYAGGQVARGGRLGVLGDRDVFETPFNVTSYTAETIADRQATRIADVVRGDPSLQVVSPSLLYQEEFLVRGFRLTQSSVSFDGTPGLVPNYGVGNLQPFERVELLKGANTLLNGVTTGLNVGGNINLVPKRATNQPITQVTVGASSDSLGTVHLDVGRRFGTDQQFGLRANVSGQDGDTAFDDAKETRHLAALALDFRGDRLRAYLDLGTHRQKTRGAPLTLYPDAGIDIPSAPSSGSNYAQSWNYSDARTRYARLKAEYDIAPDVTAFVAYGGHDSRYEQVAAYGLLHEGGDFDEGLQNGRGRAEARTLQAGLDAAFRTGAVGHRVSLSAARSRSEYRFYYPPDIASGALPTIASNIYDPVRVPRPADIAFRPFGDIRLSLTEEYPTVALADTLSLFDDRLLATLGLRWQQIKTWRYNYDGSGQLTGTYDKSATTPVIGLLYKATDRLSVYANVIEALQSGPSAPDTAVNRGEVFPPTKNRQYEIGAKVDFGRFGLSADVFDIEQPSGRLDPTTLVYRVDGEQRHRGLELNVFGEPARGVRVHGGVMFLDAKLRKTENGGADGKRVAGVARTNLAATVEWDVIPAWTLTGGVLGTGATYVDQANTQRVGGFTVFDLGLRYRTTAVARGLTVRANVSNVADKSYFIADPFGGLYQASPRTFSLSGTVDF